MLTRLFAGSGCSFLLLGSAAAVRQSSLGGSLLVLSKHAHTVAIRGLSEPESAGAGAIGDDPHEVIATEDGKTAFVSNYGFGSLHTLRLLRACLDS